MEESTTTTSDSARLLKQVKKEIAELQTLIKKMNQQIHPITAHAAKRKELGLKVEEREIILEKRRVAEVVQKFEREHPQEFEACPICLEDVISVHHQGESAFLLACCGKNICNSCCEKETQPGLTFQTCPLCRAILPTSEQETDEADFRLAENGNVWAQYKIAESYFSKAADATSEDSKKDLEEKAFHWYCQAAVKGCAPAEVKIALRYLNKGGVWAFPQVDPGEGIRMLEAAANHGEPYAQKMLACTYFYDYDDGEKTAYWCRLTAARGDPMARLHLGLGFARGEGGMDTNLERAKYYLETLETDDISSDDLGNAQFELSVVLLKLTDKRYGTTPMRWVPGHNCIFEVNSLLRKAIENGCNDANEALEHWEKHGPMVCLNCSRSQDSMPSRLLRCTRCKIARYCGKSCQKEHWKKGHNVECKKFCSGDI